MHVLSIKVLLNFKYVESNVLFPTLKSQFMYLKFEVGYMNKKRVLTYLNLKYPNIILYIYIYIYIYYTYILAGIRTYCVVSFLGSIVFPNLDVVSLLSFRIIITHDQNLSLLRLTIFPVSTCFGSNFYSSLLAFLLLSLLVSFLLLLFSIVSNRNVSIICSKMRKWSSTITLIRDLYSCLKCDIWINIKIVVEAMLLGKRRGYK